MIAAAFFALLLAVSVFASRANEVVAGTGINMLFLGLPAVLERGAVSLVRIDAADPQDELLPTLSRSCQSRAQWRVLTDVSIVSSSRSLWSALPRMSCTARLSPAPESRRRKPRGRGRGRHSRQPDPLRRRRPVGVLAGVGGAYLSIRPVVACSRAHDRGARLHRAGGADLRKWRPVQTMLACVLSGSRTR